MAQVNEFCLCVLLPFLPIIHVVVTAVSRRGAAAKIMNMNKLNSVQVIKASIAFRAKYRLDLSMPTPTIKHYSPALAVPHPKNRGGDPVKSIRTMQLSGDIVRDGCDPIEANSNAVAVEQNPNIRSDESFQALFEKKIIVDPDMTPKIMNINAVIGTLAHSHLNCTMRNMSAGTRGCECAPAVAGEEKKPCCCNNKPILDEHGCYSLELVKECDGDWWSLIQEGIAWETLTHVMDIEEPEGAIIIAIALNKKNEASMKTSHTEIMNTLVGLCKPSPDDMDGKVPFVPVRDKMIEYYGAAVDHPDLVHAFQVVMDAGGHDSPHMADLHEFTNVYVNPKLRKLRFEAYGVVSPYPVEFPRLKNASLKWAWKQTPKRGWCDLPISISHRFSGNLSMYKLMREIEETFASLNKSVSTVVEKTDKKKTKWLSETEIGVITKVFAVPRKDVRGTSVSDQENELRKECAELVANKMVLLTHPDTDKLRKFADQIPAHNGLLCGVQQNLQDPAFIDKAMAPPKSEKSDASTAVESLVPKVIKLDAEGNPISTHEVAKGDKAEDAVVEVIDCAKWAALQEKGRSVIQAKALVCSSACVLKQQQHEVPVAVIRKAGKVIVKASADIPIGQLRIPLGLQHMTSLVAVAAHDEGFTLHPHAVPVEVSWHVSEKERAAGVEQENHKMVLKVLPEFNVPRAQKDGTMVLQWTPQHSADYFWLIKRQDTENSEWNCEIHMREVTQVLAVPPVTDSAWKAEALTETFSIKMPHIVNTERIPADKEVMLRWQVLMKPKAQAKTRTWVDAVQRGEKKRQKTQEQAKEGP